ncbi:MAG TPA: DUF11 domain-containing protein [Candidatus Angelobacter sp.]|nr:DUF11 domain-containing protein [Candidatus Angelobacter sp.]
MPGSVQGQTLKVRSDVHHDVSPPLRDLAKTAGLPAAEQEEGEPVRAIPLPSGFKPANEPDPVLQTAGAAATIPVTPPVSLSPTLLLNFDGIGQGTPAGFSDCCAPPDTNGAVGLTQYVQWVNLSLAVFNKSDGSLVAGFPVAGNALWKGFGGECETSDDGDPIVLYDKIADRWVLSQLVVLNPTPPPRFGPFFQCVAVSTTPDATGSYNRYQFSYTSFDDYPKMSVWPDAYYITFNMFDASGISFLGADACAYDRAAMLAGTAATQICFQQAPTVGGVLPADMDGHTLPPPGSPNYMVEFDVNSLNLYKFHVDFTTPANSTFGPAINIPVAPFTPFCPQVRGCVPQQGTTNLVDSLGDRLMYRLAYRNFGDHESLVVNHSVVADPVNQNSGIRWYEIQNPGGTPTVTQQSTFAPDANFRWMGSIAMDQVGDIAVGYSVSSSNMFPSISIAARRAADPPNTLQPEISIMAGTGSEINGLTRWGDYSAMQVDPVDDCTFWYTTEYLKATGSFNWNTRINSFKFDTCDKPDMTIALTHSGNFTQGQTGQTYTITVTNSGGQPTDGSTVTVTDTLPPAGLTATGISGTGWTCSLGPLTCTRTDVLAPKASYPDITLTVNVSSNAPGFVTNTAAVSGGGEKNTSNDTANDGTTIIQTGPDPAITKTHSGLFIQGQTETYTIAVTNTGLSPTDGTTVTVTDVLPTGLTFNAVSGTGWSCNAASPVSCTRADALASNTSYPPITLTVNVANNAAATVTNTATVGGGGDVNPLNNTASDPTTIIPPPADLTISKTHAAGSFAQGFGAIYNLTVSNVGLGPTKGAVTVVDTLPTGITIIAASGNGWTCVVSTNLTTMTCTRGDILAVGVSYPTINLNVNVAGNAPPSVTNTATVSGGGEINTSNDTASDPTTINPAPSLGVVKSHTGNFTVGQTGTYTITVTDIGSLPTDGTAVSVTDSLPVGMTATAVNATGWSCSSLPTTFITCSRSDVLASNSSYPPIILTVNVDGSVSPSTTNFAIATGGGDANGRIAFDPTTINVPDLAITKTHNGNFVAGEQGAVYTITVTNVGSFATGGGTVSVNDFLPFVFSATAASGNGWTCTFFGTTQINCTQPAGIVAPGGSYPPITLTVNVSSTATPTTVTNVARVSGIGDANPSNNTAFDNTQIVMPVSIASTSPTTVIVSAGTTATFSFTANLSTNPPVGNVNLNVALLPPNAKATFSSNTITQSGNVTLTIDTSGNGHVASLGPSRFGPSRFGRWAAVFAAMLVGLVALFSIKRGKQRSSRPWLLAGLGASGLVLALVFVGCGGHSTPPPPPPVMTPPGTYRMTMTATSSNSGVPGAVVSLTVVVR